MLPIAIVLAALGGGGGAASPVPACQTPIAWRAAVAFQKPGADALHYAGDAARDFMAAYNALPPQTAIAADEILIFSHPGMLRRLIILFRNGCASSIDQLLPATIDKVRQRAFPEI